MKTFDQCIRKMQVELVKNLVNVVGVELVSIGVSDTNSTTNLAAAN
jgi:hypothetical protein